MTTQEALQMLSIFSYSYPASYKSMTAEEVMESAKFWAGIFPTENGDSMINAAKMYVKSDKSGFPPTPGQIARFLEQNTHSYSIADFEKYSLDIPKLRAIVNSKPEKSKLTTAEYNRQLVLTSLERKDRLLPEGGKA